MTREERITVRVTAGGKRAIDRRASEWKCNAGEAVRHMLVYADLNMGREPDAGPRQDD